MSWEQGQIMKLVNQKRANPDAFCPGRGCLRPRGECRKHPAGGPKPVEPRVVNIRVTPCYDVFIGRPGPWGNPFTHLEHASKGTIRVSTRKAAVEEYRNMIMADPELQARARRELRGKVLGCYCAPRECHGDVLLEIANAAAE